MIRNIIDIIRTELETLAWADKVGGIVDAVTVKRNGPDSDVLTKTFPAEYNINPTTCNPSELEQYVPDSSKKSILYFEDGGSTVEEETNNMRMIQHTVTLVCWCNLQKISSMLKNSSLLVYDVLDIVPDKIASIAGTPIQNVRINLSKQVTRTKDIFGRYTYDDTMRQYLIFPFDYFALEYEITYYIGKGCSTPIQINPASCQV